MKKKILSLILAICFVVPSMFIFSACGEKEEVGLKNNYKITVIQTSNGVISPDFVLDANTIELVEGSSYTFYIAAEDGYKIEHLVIDGNVKPASSTYTFTDIRDNHTIAASFVENEEIMALKLEGIKINYRTIRTDSAPTISSLKIAQDYSENNGYDFVYEIETRNIIHDISTTIGSLDGKVRSYKFKVSDIVNNVIFFEGSAKLDIYCKNAFSSGSTNFGEINESITMNLNDLTIIESDKFDTLYSYTINNSSNNYIASIELIFSAVN